MNRDQAFHSVAQLRKKTMLKISGFQGYGFEQHLLDSLGRAVATGQLVDFQFWSSVDHICAESYLLKIANPNTTYRNSNLPEVLCGFDWSSEKACDAALCALDLDLRIGQSSVMLLAPDHHLLPWFYQRGYAVEYIGLGGDCTVALEALKESNLIEPSKIDSKIEVSLLVDANYKKDQVLELFRNAYQGRSEFDWFFRSDQPSVVEKLISSYKQGQLFQITCDSQLLGLMGYRVSGSPMWFGLEGRISFCFDPSIQGKGLASWGYRRLLNELVKLNINTFSGETAHDAVICLGQRMNRPLRFVRLCPASQIKKSVKSVYTMN